MRTISFLLATGLLCASAASQTMADYLVLRNQQHIVQPTSGDKLDQLVGPSVVEIQGVIQGSFKSGADLAYIVKQDNNETLIVECSDNPPEWLNNGEVPARLLLHVNRQSKLDVMEAHLISAAPEADISRIDDAYWKAEAAKAKERTAKSASANPRPATTASRGGGDYMHGWIGKARGHREVPVSADRVLVAYRNFVLHRNPRLGAKVANEIAYHVIRFSVAYGVDARLVMAVIMVESDFDPFSTSRTGAKGIGQLMPGTATWMGVSDPYNLEQNLYGMIKLLRHLMDEYHVFQYPVGSEGYYQSLGVALAGYNAGEGAVKRFGGIPRYRETQAYVARVIEYFRRLSS